MRRWLAVVGVAGLVASGSQAAQSIPDPEVSACTESGGSIEWADGRIVASIQAELAAGHYPVVVARTAEIEALLGRHPDRHRIERCGDVIHINSGNADDALFAQADMVGTITKSTASKIAIDPTQSYLVTAYALAAALALDRRDPAAAGRWMAAGRALAPAETLFLVLAQDRYARGGALQAIGVEIFRRTQP